MENHHYNCTYDAWSRLVKVKNDTAATVGDYRYDGTARRIRKFEPETGDDWTVREYYYDNAWQCLAVHQNTNVTRSGTPSEAPLVDNLYEDYVWSQRYIDAPVLRKRGAAIRYFLTDANMNVTALVSDNGTIAETCMYDPYGKVTFLNGSWASPTSTSAKANEILYAGYRFDPETGLYHVRNRMYHPTLGRWLQRDPIGYVDGMNLYEYVRSSPVDHADPQGRGGDEKEESTKDLCLCFCVEHLKFEEIKHIQPRKTAQQSGFVGAAFNVELKGVWKKWKKPSLGKFNLEWFEWFIMKAKGQRGKAYKWNEYFLSGVHPEASVFDMVRWTGWHLRELRWIYERMEAMGATESKMYYYMADQPGVSVVVKIPTYHQVSFWAIRVSSTPGCDCRIS